MAVKREEVEALPGFLGWHTFGEPHRLSLE
jgi:hypothetical protein